MSESDKTAPLPPLPEPFATRVEWTESDENWHQWHDKHDPVPPEWDEGDAPHRQIDVYTADEMRTYGESCRAAAEAQVEALRQVIDRTHEAAVPDTLQHLPLHEAVGKVVADLHAQVEALRVQVRQADERGDEAMRRAHAWERVACESGDWLPDADCLPRRSASKVRDDEQVDALRRDAERYRWLRENGMQPAEVVSAFGTEVVAYRRGAALDAAIDSALAGRETGDGTA